MVVAGLAAEGETVISGVAHIDRGYDDLVGRLRAVGADIVPRRLTWPLVDPAAGQPEQGGDDGDRAGDEQDLVPAALVGERAECRPRRRDVDHHVAMVGIAACLNGPRST